MNMRLFCNSLAEWCRQAKIHWTFINKIEGPQLFSLYEIKIWEIQIKYTKKAQALIHLWNQVQNVICREFCKLCQAFFKVADSRKEADIHLSRNAQLSQGNIIFLGGGGHALKSHFYTEQAYLCAFTHKAIPLQVSLQKKSLTTSDRRRQGF